MWERDPRVRKSSNVEIRCECYKMKENKKKKHLFSLFIGSCRSKPRFQWSCRNYYCSEPDQSIESVVGHNRLGLVDFGFGADHIAQRGSQVAPHKGSTVEPGLVVVVVSVVVEVVEVGWLVHCMGHIAVVALVHHMGHTVDDVALVADCTLADMLTMKYKSLYPVLV